jgi:mannosyltransferase
MKTRLIKSIPLLLILMLAAGLRSHQLGQESLWFDEGASATFSGTTLKAAVLNNVGDMHPPLYVVSLYLWSQVFGRSEAGLRSLSAVLGTALVALVYLVGASWFGRRTGLLAALLAAVAPHQLYYAQEARNYALLGCLALAAAYFQFGLYRGGGGRDRIGLAAANSLMLYTHNFALFVVAAQHVHYLLALIFFRTDDRPSVKTWVGVQAVPLVLYGAWAPVLAGQTTEVLKGYWVLRPGWGTLIETFSTFAYHRNFHLYLALALLSMLAVGAREGLVPRREVFYRLPDLHWRLDLQDPIALSFPAAWIVVSIALPFAYSLCFTPLYHTRFEFTVSLPFLILVGRGIDNLRWRWLQALMLALALWGSSQGLHEYYSSPHKEQWREAVAEIERRGWPGDLVLVYPNSCRRIIYSYYQQRDDLDVRDVPQEAVDWQNMAPASWTALLADRRNAWLVARNSWTAPSLRLDQLNAIGWRVMEEKHLVGVDLYRMQRYHRQ